MQYGTAQYPVAGLNRFRRSILTILLFMQIDFSLDLIFVFFVK